MCALVGVMTLLPASLAAAAPGGLDASFGQGGEVVANVGRSPTSGRDALVQDDGKIVVWGRSGEGGPGPQFLLRLNLDGTWDPSFGTDGRADLPLEWRVHGVALQEDGKVVLVGQTRYSTLLVARYGRAGVLDPGFGAGGVFRGLPTGEEFGRYTAHDVAVQPDGRIVVAAHGTTGVMAVRLEPDGSLDPTFGANGWSTLIPEGLYNGIRVAVPRDGNTILVSAMREGARRGGRERVVIRLRADGSFDPGFGDGGIVGLDDLSREYIHGLAVEPGGRIVLATRRYGQSRVLRLTSEGGLQGSGAREIVSARSGLVGASIALTDDGRIVTATREARGRGESLRWVLDVRRFRANGWLDRGFDGEGRAQARAGRSFFPESVSVGPSGEVVVVGTTRLDAGALTPSRLAVVRFHEDGTLDVGFGEAGVATLEPADADDVPVELTAFPGGAVVLVGRTSGRDIVALWIDSDGRPNAQFGSGGRAQLDSGTIVPDDDGWPDRKVRRDDVWAAAVQPDGHILTLDRDSSYDLLRVVRMTPAGQLDPSFGSGGTARVDTGDFDAATLVVQPDGRIVFAVSHVGCWPDSHAQMGRLLPDGSIDTSFGEEGLVSFEAATVALALVDEQIVVGGAYFGIARFDADGSLDQSFGDGGIAARGHEALAYAVRGIGLQSDGSLVVAGFGTEAEFPIVRVDSNGSLDETFGEGSLVAPGNTGGDVSITDLAIQSDDKVVVTGLSHVVGGPHPLVAFRLASDGSLDPSFGEGGSVVLPGFAYVDWVRFGPDLAIGGDGSIYVSAYEGEWPDRDLVVFRLEGDSPSVCGEVAEPGASLCDLSPTCPKPGAPNFVDPDGDGRAGACDLCPDVASIDDPDTDADGVGDACDLCSYDWDPQNLDTDDDGVGDVCDTALRLEPLSLSVRGLRGGRGRVQLKGAFPDFGLDMPVTITVGLRGRGGGLDEKWSLDAAGWKRDRARQRWRFRSPHGGPTRIRALLTSSSEDPGKSVLTVVVVGEDFGGSGLDLRVPLRVDVSRWYDHWPRRAEALFSMDPADGCFLESEDHLICSAGDH